MEIYSSLQHKITSDFIILQTNLD